MALLPDRFPRSSEYDSGWQTEGSFGANPLWLAEWLCQELDPQPGMKVLDLGCGRAKSSVFLAREFGLDVWAVDLWVPPDDNAQRIQEAGVANQVTPLSANARELPFTHGTFDLILAFDSFQYFGTDDLFLPYIVQFLKPSGTLGFASAGLVREISGEVPNHLRRFWTSDAWCLHTADWWRRHWSRTGLVDVKLADSMDDGWRVWLEWARACSCSDWYLDSLERDKGQYLGYVRAIAERHPATPHLPYDLQTGLPQ